MVDVKTWTPQGSIAPLTLIVHQEHARLFGAHGPDVVFEQEVERDYPEIENAKGTAALMISASRVKTVPHLASHNMDSVHMNWILQENIARVLGIASGTVWRLVVEMANVLTVSSSKLSLLSR